MTSQGREQPERTEDGRYVVIDGRRWRATDPSIPEALRAELVAELMAARRLVRSDPTTARPRVQQAKTALGERGRAWWLDRVEDDVRARAEAAALTLLRHRAAESSICPSDVARVVGGTSWRSTMDDVRAAVASLRERGAVRVTQKDHDVDPSDVTGPVRIRRGPHWPG